MGSRGRTTVTLLLTCFAAAAELRAQAPAKGVRFWLDARLPLGKPNPEQLVNHNGSPRIHRNADFENFFERHARVLQSITADARIRLNPNYVAALLTKESGFDPSVTSHVPANGLAQITHIADADMLTITRDAPAFQWMHAEVRGWPRHELVHRAGAAKVVIDSLLKSDVVNAGNEYLFDPALSVRAATYWLRILATVWLEDEWPGAHGSFARARLNKGKPLTDEQLLELVTVSYNQGHPYVRSLIQKHGARWTRHLNDESRDYLERIKAYTLIFQSAARTP